MKKVILSLLCVISLMAAATTAAVADESQYKKLKISEGRKSYRELDLPKDSITKFSRVTWSTNMVEWLIFAPNLGLEIDLKDPTLISCPSLFLQFSYRPAKEDWIGKEHFTSNAFHYWRARAEYRWHFRLNERREQRRGLGKTAMWLDETLFTKKAETYVPDTAAIAAGDEYATRLVMDKNVRIEQKIDSTCRSTIERKADMFPGRYYLGAYGEYMSYIYNNRLLPICDQHMKQGVIYGAGLSGGYDFPGFNYNHKCFMQWSVGASVGLIYTQYDEFDPKSTKNQPHKSDVRFTSGVIPFLTELKVALNFRTSTITNKYWQPDPDVYTDNIARNHEDSIHMAEIDSVLEAHPVIINVTSVNGFDSAFVENVDKMMIVNAFKQATGLTYLLPTEFNMLEHVQTAVNNKELNDNYFIEYVTKNRLRHYQDSVFVSDRKNLPFKLQIAGREDADSLKKSFVDSLKNYYANNNNTRPIFYGTPASKDSLKGFISKDSIAAQFSRIWGHTLDTSMIRTLYMPRTESNDDGTTSTYYDSIINETQINRRQNYAMFIQFHPQVTLSGEDEGVGRFSVAMAGADRARELYNNTATFINKLAKSGMMVRIQRPWDGKNDSFTNRVTQDEVYAALQKYGMEDVDKDVVSIYDSIYTYNSGQNRDTITFNFGVTEAPIYLPFIVDDSIGKARAQALWNDTIRPWREEQYWDPRMGMYDDDPKVPAYYDSIEDTWYANTGKFIEAVKDITFADLKPYMVDSLLYRVNAKPYKTGQLAGKYRAQARIIFHREMVTAKGIFFTTIPYLLVPVESKEEAGWVPPVDSAAILKAQADSIFALTHTIRTRDSIAYVIDSLGNVLDSTVIQITDTIANALNDSLVANVGGIRNLSGNASDIESAVDTVKIVTVEEATEASKVAALRAKETAAEAKAATAAAKKAKAAATKAQKSATAAIKKAEKSVKLPETMTVTRDSIVAKLDADGNAMMDSLGNALVDTIKIEETAPFEMDSITAAAVAERDSIIASVQAEADSALKYADSLQVVAEQANAIAAEAKTAAAEAKKAIAKAKKDAKARAAEAKKKAKEEAAAAKEAAKAAKETVVAPAPAETPAAPSAAQTSTPAEPAATPNAAGTNTSNETASETAPVAEAPVVRLEGLTVAEATEASANAAAAAKEAAAESKSAAAAAKKAKADAAKAAKSAAAALKKVPATAEGEEPTEESLIAQQAADSLQNIANMAQQVADSLQNVADAAVLKMNETKATAAAAKKAIAEAKKAEKAAAAEAKKRAKEEAAAAKAAAKAQAEAAKNEAAETVTEAANEATAAVNEAVANSEAVANDAAETPVMSEKEAKAAAKKAAAEAKKKAKEEAAAAKAAAKAEAAAKKAAAAEAKKKAKEAAAEATESETVESSETTETTETKE